MKTIKSKFLVGIVLTLAMLTGGTNVFAANPYNIEYSGGVVLGSSNNVQINPVLTDELTPLIYDDDTSSLSFSENANWKEGYFKFVDAGCDKVRYFNVYENDQSGLYDDLWYTISNGVYTAKIEIKNVYIDGLTNPSPDKTYAIGITETDKSPHGVGWIVPGWAVRSEECKSDNSDILPGSQSFVLAKGLKVYIETDITLTKKGLNTPFASSELYFGITDIDQAQSFKILNTGSMLEPSNMYTEDAENLQPSPSKTELKNMYVESGRYIYSEYDVDADPKTIALGEGKGDIYVRIDEKSQKDGLDVVFGFVHAAGSGIQYFAKQYTINYKSDDGGTITGEGKEEIVSGDTLTGDIVKSNDNYMFKGWIANVDVLLSDGTTIKAGQLIANDQITKIVADQDIVLTAQHVRQFTVTYESDKNGAITGKTSEIVDMGGNPTGTTEEAKESYIFKNWIADVEITLTDGTKIAANKPITEKQIKQVVVNQDIKFTAVYAIVEEPDDTKEPEKPEEPEEPSAPNTGIITQDSSVTQKTISVIGIVLGIFLVGALSFVIRRKVDFKK